MVSRRDRSASYAVPVRRGGRSSASRPAATRGRKGSTSSIPARGLFPACETTAIHEGPAALRLRRRRRPLSERRRTERPAALRGLAHGANGRTATAEVAIARETPLVRTILASGRSRANDTIALAGGASASTPAPINARWMMSGTNAACRSPRCSSARQSGSRRSTTAPLARRPRRGCEQAHRLMLRHELGRLAEPVFQSDPRDDLQERGDRRRLRVSLRLAKREPRSSGTSPSPARACICIATSSPTRSVTMS